ncbi:branched-chain amino acid transport system II carrier protein [Corynebacterium caspium]|uniref:branched-chain amino acid transport system II carrier protein n=1 Tax=Corynebacterium caspium TaxID=234828 RepID=UPI000A06B66F|nr:branched-chain amino acid transport system II carrier protein [Corynebacterium caspium]WKD58879.1 Branched-chain amino acid transport system 2 carrier protein [Corynebacterium caspium DSM 44850]
MSRTTTQVAASADTKKGSSGLSIKLLLFTTLMLFSMYFGAGNLIFPPWLAVEAGSAFKPAIIGFLLTSVALPVIALIAVGVSGNNLRDMASRGGKFFSYAFPIIAYLAIGAFYALPRTGAVSYSTAIQPLTHWTSPVAGIIFNFIFFGVSLALAYNPNEVVSRLGQWLTPMLIILLVLLMVLAVINFDSFNQNPPAEKFAEVPLAGGLLQGYFTMDAIASLAFGIIVINALRYNGVKSRAGQLRGTAIAGIGAGALLAIFYLGLAFIGHSIPNPEKYEDGAGLLSAASYLLLGTPGQIAFGAIVLLACVTTAVGLIAASSEFFNVLLPGISYRVWAIVFAIMSAVISSMGLNKVLSIAAPIIGFIYAPAIALVLLTMLAPFVKKAVNFHMTYILGIWTAAIFSGLVTLNSIGLSAIEPFISWAPLHDLELGWVVPAVVMSIVGVIIDVIRKQEARDYNVVASKAMI